MANFVLFIMILGVIAGGVWYYTEGDKVQVIAPSGGPRLIEYACADRKWVKASFSGEQAAVQLSETQGQIHKLVSIDTGPTLGERYANDEQTVVLWIQNGDAVVIEDGASSYTKCTPRN